MAGSGRFLHPGDAARRLLDLPPGSGPDAVSEVLHGEAPLPPKIWTKVLGILGQRKRWDLSLAVLAHLKSAGQEVNEYHCGAAISACEKCGQWQAALGLLQQMREDAAGPRPNAYCYSAAIGACEKGGEWQKAILLLGGMGQCRDGVEPNHFCYSAAIRACASARQWQLAISLLSDMRPRGVEPNLRTYTAAISACHKTGQWQRSLQLLAEARDGNLEPDVVAYSSAVSACEAGRQWQQALQLLQEMAGVGVAPNSVTYNAALSACEQGSRWAEALALLGAMRAADIAPDIVAHSAAVGACMAANMKAEATSIFETLAEELPKVECPSHAFHMVVSFAKFKQDGRMDQPRGGSEAGHLQRAAELALRGLSELTARNVGLLLWAIGSLHISCPPALLAIINQRVQELDMELPWQAVGLLDYGLRMLYGHGIVLNSENYQQQQALGHGPNVGVWRCLRRAAKRVVEEAAVRSLQANAAPAKLLLSLGGACSGRWRRASQCWRWHHIGSG